MDNADDPHLVVKRSEEQKIPAMLNQISRTACMIPESGMPF